MKTYDNYEISGCHRLDRKGRPHPNGRHIETCDDNEAQFWTLYGHIDGEGAEAIGDFSSREHAEVTFFRITGITFACEREVAARLRVMRAGQHLLDALECYFDEMDIGDVDQRDIEQFERRARAAIALATGRAA